MKQKDPDSDLGRADKEKPAPLQKTKTLVKEPALVKKKTLGPPPLTLAEQLKI